MRLGSPQAGRWGAVVKQSGRHLPPAGVLCPMYSRLAECRDMLAASDERHDAAAREAATGSGGGGGGGGGSGARLPLVLCEYCHSMGNSCGSLDAYWAAFRREPRLQGGFVWDWVDQGFGRIPREPRRRKRGSAGQGRKLPATSYKLQAASYKLQATSCKLQVTRRRARPQARAMPT